jgi:hypothetical protein
MTSLITFSTIWIAACVVDDSSLLLNEYSRNERLSECHMSITEKGLNDVNQQCYCIERVTNEE